MLHTIRFDRKTGSELLGHLKNSAQHRGPLSAEDTVQIVFGRKRAETRVYHSRSWHYGDECMQRVPHRPFATVILAALVCFASVSAWAGDLTDAVRIGDLRRVEALLAAGANPNEKSAYGRPLSIAAADGSVDIARALIRANADVNAPGLAASLPLHVAARKGTIALVKLLVRRGAKLDAMDGVGRSPLIVASYYGRDVEIVEYLLAVGADGRAADRNHRTALHWAAARGWLDIVEVLLGAGVDVNVRDDNGNTPLFYAAAAARLDVAEYLIAHGANVLIDNKCGETALLAGRGYSRMEKLFRDAGAPPVSTVKPTLGRNLKPSCARPRTFGLLKAGHPKRDNESTVNAAS